MPNKSYNEIKETSMLISLRDHPIGIVEIWVDEYNQYDCIWLNAIEMALPSTIQITKLDDF